MSNNSNKKSYRNFIFKLNKVDDAEVIEYLDNKITLEEMTNKIKINTRHLVKRQYTWFKHQEENAIWIPVDKLDLDTKKIADEIIKNI